MAVELSDIHPLLQNLTWGDFDPSLNCTWAGRLLGQWWRTDPDAEYEGTSSYLMSSFAWACSPVPLYNVTRGHIVDWNTYQNSQNITIGVLREATEAHCFLEFCQRLGWGGNPDLSGVGVFAAYVTQAVLTMIFLIAYLSRSLSDWRARGRDQPPLPVWKRLDKCLQIFWISSFYFSLCVVIASFSTTYLSNNSQHSVYFSFFGSTFSVAVLGTLWPWYQSRCAHPHLALTGFSVLCIFIAAISASYHVLKTSWETGFELSCFSKVALRSEARKLLLTPIVTVAVAVVYYGIWFWFERFVRKRTVPVISLLSRSAMGLTSFILLWVCLGYFVQVRNETSDLIGESYAENHWGFGQILAVVAWIPTCAEFVKIWTWQYINTHIGPKMRNFFRLRPEFGGSDSSENLQEAIRTGLRDTELQKTNGAAVTTTATPAMDIEEGMQNPIPIPQPSPGPSQPAINFGT